MRKYFKNKLNGNIDNNTDNSDKKIHYIKGKIDDSIESEKNNNGIYDE